MLRKFKFLLFIIFLISISYSIYQFIVTTSIREIILLEDRYEGLNQEKIIQPASIAFVPYRIIPNRIRIHRVKLFPHSIDLIYKRPLEQSEILGLDDSFSIRVRLHVTFRLEPSKAVELFKKLPEYNWDTLNYYIDLRIRNYMEMKMRNIYTDDKLDTLKVNVLNWILPNELVQDLNNEFKNEGVVFPNILINELYIPEIFRYRSMLSLGANLISRKLDRVNIVEEARAQKKASEIKSSADLERWENIAKLISNYPQLRNYLAIDKLGDKVQVMVIPYNSWFEKENDTKIKSGQNSFFTATPENESSGNKFLKSIFPFWNKTVDDSNFSDVSKSYNNPNINPSTSADELNKKNTGYTRNSYNGSSFERNSVRENRMVPEEARGNNLIIGSPPSSKKNNFTDLTPP